MTWKSYGRGGENRTHSNPKISVLQTDPSTLAVYTPIESVKAHRKPSRFQKSKLLRATAKQNFGEITIILFCNNIISHFESEVKFTV